MRDALTGTERRPRHTWPAHAVAGAPMSGRFDVLDDEEFGQLVLELAAYAAFDLVELQARVDRWLDAGSPDGADQAREALSAWLGLDEAEVVERATGLAAPEPDGAKQKPSVPITPITKQRLRTLSRP